MPIRPATYKDIPAIASIFAAAFHEESMHAIFFPYRNEHPNDYIRAWRHHLMEQWWNYQKTFAVSYESSKGREVITGAAEWMRAGDGWEDLWGIKGRWDPRLLIFPFLQLYHKVHRLIFVNRASIRPSPTRPAPLTYWTWQPAIIPFVSKYLIPPTSSASLLSSEKNTAPGDSLSNLTQSLPAPENSVENSIAPSQPSTVPNSPTNQLSPHYQLCGLGVLPTMQSIGHGRALCAWGLNMARKEDLPAIVFAAEGKERFYQRCGFANLVGWATEGEGNPLTEMEIKGGAILWTEVNGGLEVGGN